MQYIAEYYNILQCSTAGLSGQSKYASTNNRNQQILTKKTRLYNNFMYSTRVAWMMLCSIYYSKIFNAILTIITLSFVAIITMHIFNITQPYSIVCLYDMDIEAYW